MLVTVPFLISNQLLNNVRTKQTQWYLTDSCDFAIDAYDRAT